MRQLLNAHLFFCSLFTVYSQSADKLLYVQAIWRHGDRAPNKLPYPNDKHNESAWPRGWSQLTNLGMMQMYKLGLYFQARYRPNFIDDFSIEDIKIISTQSDRAIVSAQAMLRGFFPANTPQQQFLPGELWQPLPFHSSDNQYDEAMLRPTDYVCSTYDDAFDKDNEPLETEINKMYSDLFEFLAKKNITGWKRVDFKKAASLVNIQREVIHNMSQPEWVYKVWPQYNNQTTLQIVENLKRIRRLAEFDTLVEARMRGGLLLNDWLTRALNLSKGQSIQPQKMLLYSAHDGTLLPLMYALGINNSLLVPYASCIIMELYSTADNSTTVKFIYKNETDSNRDYVMTVPGCEMNCTIEQLYALKSPVLISSFQQLEQICSGVIRIGTAWVPILLWIYLIVNEHLTLC